MVSQEAVQLLASEIAGRRINAKQYGEEVFREFQNISNFYHTSGQDINSIAGLKLAYEQRKAEINPDFSRLPKAQPTSSISQSYQRAGFSAQESRILAQESKRQRQR